MRFVRLSLWEEAVPASQLKQIRINPALVESIAETDVAGVTKITTYSGDLLMVTKGIEAVVDLLKN